MFRFNFEKGMQALGLLWRQPGEDRHHYLKLLKLLYVAERESLLETGHPIIGDKTFAMPYGPVLSHICDLVREEDSRPGWPEHFVRTGYELQMREDPGTELLCQYEIEKLQEVAQRYRKHNRWQLEGITKALPEYQENEPTDLLKSREIPVRDILKAGGKEGNLPDIERAAEANRAFARTFGR